MHVQQLQHLALGDHVGRVGQDFHDAHAARIDHHLERARIEEVAHQHAGGVAEHGIGGIAPAPQLGLVDHVVVQQGGGVDELHHGGQLMVAVAVVAHRARCQQQDHRAQALAAGTDDVFTDLFDQGDFGRQPLADDSINRAHVCSDRGKQGSGGRLGQDDHRYAKPVDYMRSPRRSTHAGNLKMAAQGMRSRCDDAAQSIIRA
ncbi:hypothetical protein D3C72_1486910 [compost metagenome]